MQVRERISRRLFQPQIFADEDGFDLCSSALFIREICG